MEGAMRILHKTEVLGFEVATRRTQVVASKLSY
jgi:hypothetical protein